MVSVTFCRVLFQVLLFELKLLHRYNFKIDQLHFLEVA